jgi:hypothetical protein
MSLHIIFFTPKCSQWRGVKGFERPLWDAWFYWPDEYSTGGVGVKIPFIFVCFQWTHR